MIRPAADAWYAHWVREGFDALERSDRARALSPSAPGSTLADVYLVPQVFNARRFDVSLDAYPKIAAVDAACAALEAFQEPRRRVSPDAA